MQRKVLVIGATGHLGKAIARKLKYNGYDVTAQGRNDRLCDELKREGFRVIQASDSDASMLEAACSDQSIVINCAGQAKQFARKSEYESANVNIVKALIAGCLKHNAKLIHLSSPSIYCNYEDQLNVSEECKIPDVHSSDYSYSKHEADKLIIEAANKNLRYVIFRPHLVVGPEDKKILAGLIKAHESGSIPLFRNGEVLIDLTDIENFVSAIMLAVETNKGDGKIFNISNGDPQELKQLLAELFQQINTPLKTTSMPVNFWFLGNVLSLIEKACKASHYFGFNPELFYTKYSLGLFANHFTLDISNARNILGYNPVITTKESIKRFAEEYKKSHHSTEKPRSGWDGKKVLTAGIVVGTAYLGYNLFSGGHGPVPEAAAAISEFRPKI